MARKIPYYLTSLLALVLNLKNPWVIVLGVFGLRTRIVFKNNLQFKISQKLDLLIAKETIIDDSYQLHNLHRPQTIIDVGGAFGDFAIYAASMYPDCQVIVFEPNPESFRLLTQNIKINKLKNVQAIPSAVGKTGNIKFYIGHDNVQSSQMKSANNKKSITVRSVALAKFINGDVDLLKIDTEGAEVGILQSMTKDSYLKIKKIVCEYHNHLVDNQDESISEILKKNGYKVTKVEDPYFPSIGYIFGQNSNIH